ncbi:uncharacterized protein LOC120448655 [Drosophila santomea]|uniref:uncharacterized protein LOC120448655 n=1 Tax=Drosophila santomea TaxID=129105 RepID=UPI001954C529|nr:uncharacterized protein LOC120448655 [Drosophila santomea]
MATRIKVMGQCPYCNRHVAKDLRPINMLSARDAKRISQLINEVQPPVQLDSEEEKQDREEPAHDSGSRKAHVSKRRGKKDSVTKTISKKNKKSPFSQDKLKIGTRSGKTRDTRRKKVFVKLSESDVESEDPSLLGSINKETRSRTTRVSKRKNRIQHVSDSEEKIDDSCSREDLNKDKSLQENVEEVSCTPKELNECHSYLEKFVEDFCFQDELEKSYSQDKLENEAQKGVAEEDKSENSLNAITGCIMELVEEEFERDPACSGSSGILKGNAEIIVAMLAEEQNMIKKIRKRSSQSCWWEADEPPPKRRRC